MPPIRKQPLLVEVITVLHAGSALRIVACTDQSNDAVTLFLRLRIKRRAVRSVHP